jgi:hypothetical protein
MENGIWIDLGQIGHKSVALRELFQNEYLTELPQQYEENGLKNNWVVFIDYVIGGELGTKVFTNAFNGEFSFHKELSQKLIKRYVETTKPLDFESDF